MDILPGHAPLILDVRQSGSGPGLALISSRVGSTVTTVSWRAASSAACFFQPGVPEQAIRDEDRSANTWQNVEFALPYLQEALASLPITAVCRSGITAAPSIRSRRGLTPVSMASSPSRGSPCTQERQFREATGSSIRVVSAGCPRVRRAPTPGRRWQLRRRKRHARRMALYSPSRLGISTTPTRLSQPRSEPTKSAEANRSTRVRNEVAEAEPGNG